LVQDFHPLTPQPSNPNEGEVINFVSEDKEECVIFAFWMPNEPIKRRVKLRGILPNEDYYVRDLLNSGKPINLVKGDTLMSDGLELDLAFRCEPVEGWALQSHSLIHKKAVIWGLPYSLDLF
jgi:hypothetical protein